MLSLSQIYLMTPFSSKLDNLPLLQDELSRSEGEKVTPKVSPVTITGLKIQGLGYSGKKNFYFSSPQMQNDFFGENPGLKSFKIYGATGINQEYPRVGVYD